MAEDEIITRNNNIVKFTTAAVESVNTTFKEPPKQDQSKQKPVLYFPC